MSKNRELPCRRCGEDTKHQTLESGAFRCLKCGLWRQEPQLETTTKPTPSIVGSLARSLSTPEKRLINDTIADCEEAIRALKQINSANVEVIVRRDAISAEVDGFAANTRPKAGGSGGKSDPTFATVTQGQPGDEGSETEDEPDDFERNRLRDPQALASARFFASVASAHKAALDARSAMLAVITAGDKERGREQTGDSCALCGGPVSNVGEDRKRAGFGPKCSSRWYKFKAKHKHDIAPDDMKARFRVEREAEFATGELRCGEIPTERARARVISGAYVPAHVDPDDVERLKAAGVIEDAS